MRRRILAALAALTLAGLGAVVLLGYVAGADQRAMAGMQTTTVLVLTGTVPEGTPATEITELVTAEELPAKAVVDGAVTALGELDGLVTTAPLHPGEQVLRHRFADPATLTAEAAVEIPDGLHQATVQLDAQRVLGGHLAPGDTVGVFISLPEAQQTHLVLHKVLVTRVQGGIAAAPTDEDAPPQPEAPAGSLMVTLALDAADAERLVFGAQHGTLWLSLEPEDAPEGGTRIVDPEKVFE